ncbi:MAG: ABC transporter ATP-binding protein [Alphaproteobacteria bacterium]|nr:ABC transporter ATP-binding protein [Alphaproteobacteria bacterium]
MADYIIRIENVTKQFAGGAKAVDGVSVNIERGEFFSLLGPSGCGKTTLLRMIAGFEFPSEGEIFIDGQASSLIPSYKRPTNMVFQSYAIFPHLNVFDNIAYGLRKEGLPGKELNRRVEESLAMIKLTGFGKRRGDQLSGGQRQRVALARALVKRPKVLLLDEPLGALDKKLREEMQIELRQLQKSVGITFVFVTHDQEEALSMSDRIAVMSKGDVLQIAGPKELYEAPNCIEVASFIGNINLINATVKGVNGGEIALEGPGFGSFGAPSIEGVKAGDKIVAAIRPEKLSLTAQKPTSGAFVEGMIKASAYLGDRSHHQVFVKGRDEAVSVAAQNMEREMSADFDASKPVYVTWDPKSLILLKS